MQAARTRSDRALAVVAVALLAVAAAVLWLDGARPASIPGPARSTVTASAPPQLAVAAPTPVSKTDEVVALALTPESAPAAAPNPAYPAEHVTLDVEVVDDLDRPIAKAHVFPHWGDARGPGRWTDDHGRCSLPTPIHSRCLEVDRVETSPTDPRRFALVTFWRLEEEARHVRIVVRTYSTVAGRIVDGNGTSIPNARIVAIDDRAREGLGPQIGQGQSDDRGAFRFDVASSRPFDLVFDGMLESPAVHEIGLRGALRGVEAGDQNVVLHAREPGTNGSLRIFVRDEVGSVVGAKVRTVHHALRRGWAPTDETGCTIAHGLLEWPCHVLVETHPDDPTRYRRTETGPVVPDGRDVVVTLRRPTVVRGLAVAADGQPLAAAWVSVASAGRFVACCATDGQGRFETGLDLQRGASMQLSARWPHDRPSLRGHADGIRAGLDEPEITLHPWTGPTENTFVVSRARGVVIRVSGVSEPRR